MDLAFLRVSPPTKPLLTDVVLYPLPAKHPSTNEKANLWIQQQKKTGMKR